MGGQNLCPHRHIFYTKDNIMTTNYVSNQAAADFSFSIQQEQVERFDVRKSGTVLINTVDMN